MHVNVFVERSIEVESRNKKTINGEVQNTRKLLLRTKEFNYCLVARERLYH